jgi:hypothetical protein
MDEARMKLEWDELAELGLAMESLTHELGNSLNRMMLQAALVKKKAPATLAGDLDVIRDEGRAVANLLQPLHQMRQAGYNANQPVNVVAVFSALAKDRGWNPQTTAQDLPPFVTSAIRLRWFLNFWLNHWLPAPGPAEPLSLAARRNGNDLILEVQWPSGDQGWEPVEAAVVLDSIPPLCRYAVEGAARLLGSSWRCEKTPTDGRRISFQFAEAIRGS